MLNLPSSAFLSCFFSCSTDVCCTFDNFPGDKLILAWALENWCHINQHMPEKNAITYRLLFWLALAHQFGPFVAGGVIVFNLASPTLAFLWEKKLEFDRVWVDSER